LPSSEVGSEVLNTIWETFYNVTSEVVLELGVIGTIAFQPMPRTITSKAKARGGVSWEDALNLYKNEFSNLYLPIGPT
jgi:hypothetical protein